MTQTSDLVLIELADGNLGVHGVIGPATRTNYGYHAHGQQFYVRSADADNLVASGQAIMPAQPVVEEVATTQVGGVTLADVWGLNEERIADLAKAGVTTVGEVAEMTTDAMFDAIGISTQSAQRIINAAKRMVDA